MFYSTKDLLDKYKNYSNPQMKILLEVKNGNLIRITRGLYEDNKDVDAMLLSQYIKSPSYISFEYVLNMHNLIPESVKVITCATRKEKHSYRYQTPFGTYEYRDIPKKVYVYGIETKNINGYSYCIASKEKALCDLLSIKRTCKSIKKLKELLFEDLRIDEEEFKLLNFDDLLFLCPLYRKTNLNILSLLIRKEYKNESPNIR